MIPTFVLLAFLFFLSVIIDSNHAVPIDDEKIVGGQEAPPNAYSWEVSLGDIKGVPSSPQQRQAQKPDLKLNAHFCGGVLLTKDWVVTAAHCVVNHYTRDDPLPANEIGVGVGSKDLIDIYNRGRVPASQIIIKPGYNSRDITSFGDIALIRLSTPVNVTKIKPACLHSGRPPPNRVYSKLTAIGWGSINPIVRDELSGKWSGYQASQRLKQVDVRDISHIGSSCKGRPDLICLASITPKHGACRGDSGGSLVSNKNLVVGLTSFGGTIKVGKHKIQTCNGDGSYTRTSNNTAWIKSIIKDRFCVV